MSVLLPDLCIEMTLAFFNFSGKTPVFNGTLIMWVNGADNEWDTGLITLGRYRHTLQG